MAFFRSRRGVQDAEREVSAARAASGEAFALAHEHSFGLDDIDHDVLVEQLRAANTCLTSLLWALHPELDKLDRAEVDARIGELVRRARERDGSDDPRTHLFSLVMKAIAHVERVHTQVMRTSRPPIRLMTELDACAWHLATAVYVLDRDALAPMLVGSPVARLQLHSAEQLMELALSEQREIARERRRSG